MALPTTLKPFPNPVPTQNIAVNAIMTRGNDNLLAANINSINDEVAGLEGGTVAVFPHPFLLMGA